MDRLSLLNDSKYKTEILFFILYILVFLLESSTRELLVLKTNLVLNLAPIIDQVFIIIGRKIHFIGAILCLFTCYKLRDILLNAQSDYLNNIKTLLTTATLSENTIKFFILILLFVASFLSKFYGTWSFVFILVYSGILFLPFITTKYLSNFLLKNFVNTLPIFFLSMLMILFFENKYFVEYLTNDRDLIFSFSLYLLYLFFSLSFSIFAPEEEKANFRTLSQDLSFFGSFFIQFFFLLTVCFAHFFLSLKIPNLGVLTHDRLMISNLFILIFYFLFSFNFLTTLKSKHAITYRKASQLLSFLVLLNYLSVYILR